MADSTNSIIGLIDFDGTLFDTDGMYDMCIDQLLSENGMSTAREHADGTDAARRRWGRQRDRKRARAPRHMGALRTRGCWNARDWRISTKRKAETLTCATAPLTGRDTAEAARYKRKELQ